MNTLKLLKRYDTKFLFHEKHLKTVIDHLSQHYEILEIGRSRDFRYENLYYDTDDYFFYHQHHNQRLNRYKVRCRRYVESDRCYFEVKFKSNRNKTIKSRLLLNDKNFTDELSDESKTFARNAILMINGDIIDHVKPKMRVKYNRITFANKAKKERITIDRNLTYTDNAAQSRSINNLVIAELKSEKFSPNSEFYQYLKNLEIFPVKFSKYCMGIAINEKNIKHNRFKKKILALEKLI